MSFLNFIHIYTHSLIISAHAGPILKWLFLALSLRSTLIPSFPSSMLALMCLVMFTIATSPFSLSRYFSYSGVKRDRQLTRCLVCRHLFNFGYLRQLVIWSDIKLHQYALSFSPLLHQITHYAALLFLFAWPRVYEEKKALIDQYYKLAQDQLKTYINLAISKLPLPKPATPAPVDKRKAK